MKNTWNIRKKEDAVSPVIATILMVAITVVLAAVLYVMVIGFGTGGDATPAGSWAGAEATSVSEGRVTFGTFSQDVKPLDLRLLVYEDGTLWGTLTWTANDATAPAQLNGEPAGAWANYTDLNPSGALINSGDYIEFDGLTSGSVYTFTVFHIPSDAEVQMTGGNDRINVP